MVRVWIGIRRLGIEQRRARQVRQQKLNTTCNCFIVLYAFHGQENEWHYMFERGSWVGDCVWRLIASLS